MLVDLEKMTARLALLEEEVLTFAVPWAAPVVMLLLVSVLVFASVVLAAAA